MTQSVREAAQAVVDQWPLVDWLVFDGVSNATVLEHRLKRLSQALASPDPPCHNCAEMTKQRDHYMAKVAELELRAALEGKE